MENPTTSQGRCSRPGRAAGREGAPERRQSVRASRPRHLPNATRQDSLIEYLHTAQELFGFLLEDSCSASRASWSPASRLRRGDLLQLLLARAEGQAHLRRLPRHRLLRRRRGAQPRPLSKDLGVEVGQLDPQRLVSLEGARCLGACGLAPAVV